MRYQKIHSQIWHDEKFINLSEDARMLFFYLLSSPHSNSIGIYVLPKPYITSDLKWPDKRLGKPLRELLLEGLILYDETARLVCIPNHCKHNPLENENQTKAAIRILSSLPKSPLYSSILELFRKPFHKQLRELLAKQYSQPLSLALALTVALTEEIPVPDFEDFYKAYPKKKAKQDALKAWKAFSPPPELFASILAALEAVKKTEDWTKDAGKYIPLPASWLRGRRWEDEIKGRLSGKNKEHTQNDKTPAGGVYADGSVYDAVTKRFDDSENSD